MSSGTHVLWHARPAAQFGRLGYQDITPAGFSSDVAPSLQRRDAKALGGSRDSCALLVNFGGEFGGTTKTEYLSGEREALADDGIAGGLLDVRRYALA